MSRFLKFIMPFLAIAVISHAQPVINDIEGGINPGDEVALYGEFFGEGDYLPISWDDFENGTPNTQVGAPIIGPNWTTLSRDPKPSYSDDMAISGNNSVFITWPNYSISAFGWSNQGPFQSLYITFFRHFTPEDTENYPHNFKMMYLYGNARYGTQNDSPHFLIGAIMPTRTNWIYAIQNHPTQNFYWQKRTNYWETCYKWQRWEVYADIGSGNGTCDGQIEGWLDADKVFHLHNINMSDSPGQYRDFRLGHMFQGHDQNDKCYYDDVYISRTRARVEIGNSQDFESCSKREIQIPEVWTNNYIRINLNFNIFDENENLFLFVVDENGNQSDGFPLNANQHCCQAYTPNEIYQCIKAMTYSDQVIILSYLASLWEYTLEKTTDPFINLFDGNLINNSEFVLSGVNFGTYQEQAIVMLGDNPVLQNCTYIVSQAVTSWKDNYIIFDVVLGSFTNDDDVYMFVVDENGTASPGKQFKIPTEEYCDLCTSSEMFECIKDMGQLDQVIILSYLSRFWGFELVGD